MGLSSRTTLQNADACGPAALRCAVQRMSIEGETVNQSRSPGTTWASSATSTVNSSSSLSPRTAISATSCGPGHPSPPRRRRHLGPAAPAGGTIHGQTGRHGGAVQPLSRLLHLGRQTPPAPPTPAVPTGAGGPDPPWPDTAAVVEPTPRPDGKGPRTGYRFCCCPGATSPPPPPPRWPCPPDGIFESAVPSSAELVQLVPYWRRVVGDGQPGEDRSDE